MEFDPVAYTIIVLIVLALLGLVYIIYTVLRKKKEGPSHLEMYFDANFRNIIDEWDLMPRSRLKDWKGDMNRRLDILDKDIEYIYKQKAKLEPRMNKLEEELAKLEKM